MLCNNCFWLVHKAKADTLWRGFWLLSYFSVDLWVSKNFLSWKDSCNSCSSLLVERNSQYYEPRDVKLLPTQLIFHTVLCWRSITISTTSDNPLSDNFDLWKQFQLTKCVGDKATAKWDTLWLKWMILATMRIDFVEPQQIINCCLTSFEHKFRRFSDDSNRKFCHKLVGNELVENVSSPKLQLTKFHWEKPQKFLQFS